MTEDRRYINSSDRLGLTDEEYEMLLQARIDLYGSGDPLSLSLLGHGIDTAHRPRRW